RLVAISLFAVASAIVLAGCQAPAKTSNAFDGKTVDTHSDPGMHDMKTPPQGNVDATGRSDIEITIDNFVFSPSDVTISPGTKVTWLNKDEAPHTATSTDKKFNSGGLDTDDNFSFVFNDKGDYPYICTLHPQMKATIKVK
ncbi:MAG: cupredoxin domain-containing protein, partial [Pyrinomonadaceae bacterium]